MSQPQTPQPETRNRRRRWLVPAIWGLLVGLVLTAGAVAVLSLESQSVVRSARQSPSVSYSDNSTHYLAVKRYVSIGAPVVGGTRHELWLGRDPGLNYGHRVALDITGADPERFEADWTEQGVRVRFESGHEIFVPARSFIGGR